jgi:hypothetical protein
VPARALHIKPKLLYKVAERGAYARGRHSWGQT